MKKALYIGSTIGNYNSAMRLHAINTACILRSISYETTFICYGKDHSGPVCEDSFCFYYTEVPNNSIESTLERITNNSLWKAIKKVACDLMPDIVILYGVEPELRVIKYCKKHKIPCFLEKVDWFERQDRQSFINKYVFQTKVDICFSKIDFLSDGIISISPYIHDYFTNNGMKSIFVPPTFERPYYSCAYNRNPHEKISIVYAGSLGGGKDSIIPAIHAIRNINRCSDNMTLHLIGITEKEICNIIHNYSQGKFGIITYGRIPHSDVIKLLYKCDFSILLRENRRYAKAGFSTKFAESMFCGVPVICTAVGGADTIISDGIDGFLIEDNSDESIFEVFELLMSFNNSDIQRIKDNAYQTGMRYFLSDVYKDKVENFILDVVNNK